MSREQERQKLSELVSNIYSAIKEAEKYADETYQSFSLDISYRMGGTYYPTKPEPKYETISRKQAIEELSSNTSLSEQRLNLLREVLINTKYQSDTYLASEWRESSCGYDYEGWQNSSSQC